MRHKITSEENAWNDVKSLLGRQQVELGRHWAYNLYNDPKRLAFVLSRYKFAAKMGSQDKDVLELGCSEGIGVPILSEFARSYTGIDIDSDAIKIAKRNWHNKKIKFKKDNFLGKVYGAYDTIVSLDVVEHIVPDSERFFFDTIYANLRDNGIGIVGTPNITASAYASTASQAGHVNMFDAQHLERVMQQLFHNVFIFGVNDEIVHTGFTSMVHYLICLGCNKKTRSAK